MIRLIPLSDILKNHEKRGKTYYPKFSDVTKIEYIDSVYPEVAWLAFLIHDYGFESAFKCVQKLACAAKRCLAPASPVSSFAFSSSYKRLAESDWRKILGELGDTIYADLLSQALAQFVRCYPSGNPFVHLLSSSQKVLAEPTDADRDIVAKVLGTYSDKRSHPGVLLNAMAVRIEICQGDFSLPSDFPSLDFDSLVADVNLINSSAIEGFVRCTLSSSYMASTKIFDVFGKEWAMYFWQRGLVLEQPSTIQSCQTVVGPVDHLEVLERDFRLLVNDEVDALASHLYSAVAQKYVHWVINGLMARQATLAVRIAGMPGSWTQDVGPVLLRSMIDCYITLAWIMKDPEIRSRTYIDYGLGQEKLHIEHLTSISERLEDPDQRASCLDEIRQRTAWVNSQQYLFLTPVNVGNWAGIDTRKMAIDIGCEEVYNLEFRPKSAIAHNSWNAIARDNLRPASSALHLTVRLPVVDGCSPDPSIPIHAACYLQSSMATVVEAMALNQFKVPDFNIWMQTAISSCRLYDKQ